MVFEKTEDRMAKEVLKDDMRRIKDIEKELKKYDKIDKRLQALKLNVLTRWDKLTTTIHNKFGDWKHIIKLVRWLKDAYAGSRKSHREADRIYRRLENIATILEGPSRTEFKTPADLTHFIIEKIGNVEEQHTAIDNWRRSLHEEKNLLQEEKTELEKFHEKDR